jgi:hypothetical protein
MTNFEGRRAFFSFLINEGRLTPFPFILVLLHIGPGVVLDVALLVAVFAPFESASSDPRCSEHRLQAGPIEPIPSAAQTFAPSEVGGS